MVSLTAGTTRKWREKGAGEPVRADVPLWKLTAARAVGYWLVRPLAGHRASHAGGRWAAQRRKSGRTLEKNDSDPRCACALVAAGGARRRGHRADGLYDDAVDRQLAAGTTVDAGVGRHAGRDRRLLPREPGRHACRRRRRLRAARAGRGQLEPHVAE
ncbi:hypothetical protein BDI4_210149 [Burkholderia diffusa]|nr:hypothetical protein BDI4_210149 [Burkholderia diffusa]